MEVIPGIESLLLKRYITWLAHAYGKLLEKISTNKS